MKGLTKSELDLLGYANGHLDHFDNADAAMGGGNNQPAQLAHQQGNPVIVNGAQYSVSNTTVAFTLAAGVFTQINFSALPAGSKSAFFFYNNNDANTGYANSKALLPLPANFIYGTPFAFGVDSYPAVLQNGVLVPIDATVQAMLLPGDYVVPITITTGGVNYVILSIHRCQQVNYTTLLRASISNSFHHKGIRYFLQDETTAVLLQYTQALYNTSLSWLGKFERDSTDVNSNNQPFQFKKNAVDVPIQMGITKGDGFASYVTLTGIAGNTLVISLSTWVSNAINPQK